MGNFHGILRLVICLLSALLVTGCAGKPQGVEPVQDFELGRYLGRWYEVARLDHSFERGLTRVRAEYGLREDGDIQVVNWGYQEKSGRWKLVVGRAQFVGSASEGYLKVSFFWPFYGAYVITELDRNYQYALVSGANRNYLWILAREPELAEEVLQRLVARARELGFATEKLIYPQAEGADAAGGVGVDLK